MFEPQPYLEKVTAFITRGSPGAGQALLLIQHPHAGVQLPAGTVEEGETLEQAALREAWEETGLSNLRVVRRIGWRDDLPPGATHVIHQNTTVFSRPDPESFDWAQLRRGISVQFERRHQDYAQITYAETDRWPDAQYTTYQITGWVPIITLALTNRRYFFHLAAEDPTPERWLHIADNHRFELFWAGLDDLPEIVYPQQAWLDFVRAGLGYQFE